MASTTRRLRSRFAATVTALGLALGMVGVVTTQPTAAAGILPSVTTVTSTDNPALEGNTTTLTATVTILGTNLGPITPRGIVVFAKDLVPVASAPLGSCLILLKACTASAVVDVGSADSIMTARYMGDLLTRGSTGSIAQQVSHPEPCSIEDGCTVYEAAADGTADVTVFVEGTGPVDSFASDAITSAEGDASVDIYFTTVPSACTTPGTGDGVVVNVSDGLAKTLRFRTFNQEAVQAAQNPNRLCYESNMPFTTAGGGSATQIGEFTYVGFLPTCSENDGVAPCILSSEFTPASGPCSECDPRARLDTYIEAPGGDPKGTR